jgi:hypothetical protein
MYAMHPAKCVKFKITFVSYFRMLRLSACKAGINTWIWRKCYRHFRQPMYLQLARDGKSTQQYVKLVDGKLVHPSFPLRKS